MWQEGATELPDLVSHQLERMGRVHSLAGPRQVAVDSNEPTGPSSSAQERTPRGVTVPSHSAPSAPPLESNRQQEASREGSSTDGETFEDMMRQLYHS